MNLWSVLSLKYTHYANVTFLALTLYYSYIGMSHRQVGGAERMAYKAPPTTSCEPVIISE